MSGLIRIIAVFFLLAYGVAASAVGTSASGSAAGSSSTGNAAPTGSTVGGTQDSAVLTISNNPVSQAQQNDATAKRDATGKGGGAGSFAPVRLGFSEICFCVDRSEAADVWI